MENSASLTQLLVLWSHGDRAALEELTPHVYRELRLLARAYLGRGQANRTLQPTELINEAYLRLISPGQHIEWENRAHFFGIAARLMRLVLVDHSRARMATKRGSGEGTVALDETSAISQDRILDVLEVDEALQQLAAVEERKAKVIELRYFGGLSREEIAEALSLTVPTVKRDLRLGEAWLRRYLNNPEKPAPVSEVP